MRVMSIAAGFSIQFTDGKDGKDISHLAVLDDSVREMLESDKEALGCWRSHLNALNEFLYAGMETALILKDDLDWDIHLKATLSVAASKIKEMQSKDDSMVDDPNLPYGNNWDMIYLGNCAENDPKDPKSWPYRTYKDSTVPKPDTQPSSPNHS